MKKSQMIALYEQDQRKAVEYPEMRRDATPEVVRYIDTSDFRKGLISYSQINEANVEDTIREQVSFFEGIGQDFEWKVYDYDQPSDLKERLGSYGFHVEEAEAIMVLDLKDAPEIFWRPVFHKVQRIINPDKLVDVQSVERQVWDEDSSGVLHFLGSTLSKYPDQMSVYVAYIHEQPASAAWIFFPKHSQFASLWGGATISRFRNQGLFTALLAVRAQEAKIRQVRYLTVDAMPMSGPILEKLGFQMIASSYPCQWKIKSPKQRVSTKREPLVGKQ